MYFTHHEHNCLSCGITVFCILRSYQTESTIVRHVWSKVPWYWTPSCDTYKIFLYPISSQVCGPLVLCAADKAVPGLLVHSTFLPPARLLSVQQRFPTYPLLVAAQHSLCYRHLRLWRVPVHTDRDEGHSSGPVSKGWPVKTTPHSWQTLWEHIVASMCHTVPPGKPLRVGVMCGAIPFALYKSCVPLFFCTQCTLLTCACGAPCQPIHGTGCGPRARWEIVHCSMSHNFRCFLCTAAVGKASVIYLRIWQSHCIAGYF